MSSLPRPSKDPPSTLSMKLGSWFEATATGWGIAAIPAALALLLAFAAARVFWS